MANDRTPARPRIAVFSGPAATIQNSQPLVTSNLARVRAGLPPRTGPDGTPLRFDALRPQRLAAPVTVYVEQFSAHPLEADAAELYGPPDGYLDANGTVHRQRQGPDDVPVYEVTLRPEDGLIPLPYMALQADGSPWEDDGTRPGAPPELCRQPYYPDASRIFEEIDRLGVDDDGLASMLARRADYDFFRGAPSGGYKQGLSADQRTDVGEGDIAAERLGEDFFIYRPFHLRREPTPAALARLTNRVQQALQSGRYAGAIWLEGSPFVDETAYWLNLLIDTDRPMAANAAQRTHGSLSADGDRNIVDSVDYITSGIWAGADGRDTVGTVVVQDEVIFTAREAQKADARPGGFVATGGHGGVVGSIGQPGPPVLTFRPTRRHTYTSAVNLTCLPASVPGTRRTGSGIGTVVVAVKNAAGELQAGAIPKVTTFKFSRYLSDDNTGDLGGEVEILGRVEKNLRDYPLAGIVGEGGSPFGHMSPNVDAAMRRAVFSGMPVVRVGRGNAEGFTPVYPGSPFISGANLTATKARLLLMACLLRFGALPPAADPDRPTAAERAATLARVAEYQAVFASH